MYYTQKQVIADFSDEKDALDFCLSCADADIHIMTISDIDEKYVSVRLFGYHKNIDCFLTNYSFMIIEVSK